MRFFLIGLVIITTINPGSAQTTKFGHVHIGIIMQSMPEAQQADSLLVLLRDSLLQAGQARVLKFQEDYNTFAKVYQEGGYTVRQAEEGQAKLQQEYAEIQKAEEAMDEALEVRRRILLRPILERLDQAIQDVGKEGNFTFIFDASIANTILFAEDAQDVAALVKAKLGLK
jgi:outer membrane protein